MDEVDNWEDLVGGDDDEPQQEFDEEPDEVNLPDPAFESLPEKYRNLTEKADMMNAILELHKQLSAAPKPSGEKKAKKPAKEQQAELPPDQELSPEELESLKIARKKEMESRELAEVAEMYGEESDKRISIDDFQPASKDDFIKFREALVEKITRFDRSPHYKNEYFMDELLQGIVKDINSKRIRSAATGLRKFAEQKDKKEKEKNVKPKKAQLAKGSKGKFDDDLHGFADASGPLNEDLDDFDFI